MPKATATNTIPDLAPAIARLRQIAAEAGDHLLLGDGPPNPDAELLEVCGDALHHLLAAKAVYDTRPWGEHSSADYSAHRGRAASFMHRAKNLRATTAAGIYAKALCVRLPRAGEASFAMSLAEDLIANPALTVRSRAAGGRP